MSVILLRDKALHLARREAQQAVREEGGPNHGPRIKQYLAAVGLTEGFPWCAAFICWCFQKAAKLEGKLVPFESSASAITLWHNLDNRGWRLDVTRTPERTYNYYPAEGDLVFWHRGPSSLHEGHVGIVEFAHPLRYGSAGLNLIQTIEGNHGDAVQRVQHIWDHEPLLIGFQRVPTAFDEPV